jgi:hypothetical protein
MAPNAQATPEEIVAALSRKEVLTLMVAMAAVVQDQLSLEQYFEETGKFDQVLGSREFAYRRLLRVMVPAMPLLEPLAREQ